MANGNRGKEGKGGLLDPVESKTLQWFLYLTVACCGAAILIVEILGAKLLAPYYGTSHFVWTAQITVTLLALACGYATGGILADRWPQAHGIYAALTVAAMWLVGVALLVEPVSYAMLRFGLPVGSLLTSLMLFFVPLGAMATVGPYSVKLLTAHLGHVGTKVGRLTALSTIGSVLGALLIGYVLLPRFSNITILIVVATMLVLLVLSYLLFARRQIAVAILITGITMCGSYLANLVEPLKPPAGLKELHRQNSNFGLLQVVEREDGLLRYFLNDLLIQNTWIPSTGQSGSMFTYMLHGLTRAYRPDARRILCIGLGIGIVPTQLAREGAHVDVVEINPAVLPIVQRYFGFDPSLVHLYFMDGRAFLTVCTNRYDAIVIDAFVGDSSPSNLMTLEAFEAVKRCLEPSGVVVMNAFGELSSERQFLTSSLYQTLEAVFPTVRLYTSGNGNLFYVASPSPHMEQKGPLQWPGAPERLRYELELASKPVSAPPKSNGMVLTDAFNPVEYYDAQNRIRFRKLLALSFSPNRRNGSFF